MGDDFNKDHYSHDSKWIYSTDQMVACVACIVQTIEDPDVSRLKKTPSIALLSKLVQISDVIHVLKVEPNVTCHITHVVLGKNKF